MSAQILDGKALAKECEAQLKARVEALKERTGKTPISSSAMTRPAPLM